MEVLVLTYLPLVLEVESREISSRLKFLTLDFMRLNPGAPVKSLAGSEGYVYFVDLFKASLIFG